MLRVHPPMWCCRQALRRATTGSGSGLFFSYYSSPYPSWLEQLPLAGGEAASLGSWNVWVCALTRAGVTRSPDITFYPPPSSGVPVAWTICSPFQPGQARPRRMMRNIEKNNPDPDPVVARLMLAGNSALAGELAATIFSYDGADFVRTPNDLDARSGNPRPVRNLTAIVRPIRRCRKNSPMTGRRPSLATTTKPTMRPWLVQTAN